MTKKPNYADDADSRLAIVGEDLLDYLLNRLCQIEVAPIGSI